MSRMKDHRFTRPIQAIKAARENKNPQEEKKALGYLIGVLKQYPTVDQLTAWLDFYFSQLEYDEDMVSFLRQPYIEAGKFSIEEVQEVKPKKLKFKDNGLNGSVRMV